jgi:hypothetical protein
VLDIEAVGDGVEASVCLAVRLESRGGLGMMAVGSEADI